MIRWLLILCFCLIPALAFAGDPQVDTIQGQNADSCFDTRVRQNTAYNTYGYGGDPQVAVDGATAGSIQKGIFWYDNIIALIGAVREVDSAFLELHVETENNATITARQFLKNTVVEDTATGTHTETGAICYAAWSYPGSLWGKIGADSLIAVGTENSTGALVDGGYQYPTSAEGWTNSTNATYCDDARASTSGTAYLNTTGFPHLTGTVIVDSIIIIVQGYGSVAAGNVNVGIGYYDTEISEYTYYDWVFVDLTTSEATYTVRGSTDRWFGLTSSAYFLLYLNSDVLTVAVVRDGTAATVYVDCVTLKCYYRVYSPDYDSTTLSQVAVTDTGWYRWNVTPLAQAAYANTLTAIRVLLTGNAGTSITLFTSSEGTAAARPRWIVYHSDTVTVVGVPNVLHGPAGSGVLHGISGGSVLHGP